WGLSGLARWTSGFPFSVGAGSGWATDFELEGTSFVVGAKPKTGVFHDSNGNPQVFNDPQSNITCACTSPQGPPVAHLRTSGPLTLAKPACATTSAVPAISALTVD